MNKKITLQQNLPSHVKNVKKTNNSSASSPLHIHPIHLRDVNLSPPKKLSTLPCPILMQIDLQAMHQQKHDGILSDNGIHFLLPRIIRLSIARIQFEEAIYQRGGTGNREKIHNIFTITNSVGWYGSNRTNKLPRVHRFISRQIWIMHRVREKERERERVLRSC